MQFIYRGQTFAYSPVATASSRVLSDVYRNLFYRGIAYRCQLAVVRPIAQPATINWRFALPCTVSGGALKPAH